MNPLAHQPWIFAGFAARVTLTVYACLVLLFLIAPLAVAVILSFSGGPALTLPPPSWSVRWFLEAYRNEHFRTGFLNSIVIAASAAGIAAIAGTAAAVAINHYQFRFRLAVQALVLTPLSLPGIALGLGILFALPDYGLAPGSMATILGHSVLAIPYVCTMVLATLAIMVRLAWESFTLLALLVFLMAIGSVIAGMIGMILEQKRRATLPPEDDRRPPQIHRHKSWEVDRDMVEKLAHADKALKERADQMQWVVDQASYEEHHDKADSLARAGDLPGAFREYCRAMRPLTEACHKHRSKEEIFQPVWDKSS